MGNKKLSHIVVETERQKEREVKVDTLTSKIRYDDIKIKPIKLLKLSIIIRAGSLDDIIGLIPRVTGDFIGGNEKIGSWCNEISNYEFKLSEK